METKAKILIIAVLGICSSVFAFAGGSGTEDDPLQIATVEHLFAVNENLQAHYILISNIDMVGDVYDDAVIAPSDYNDDAFGGNFDGNGFAVKNLTIEAQESDNIGFFGKIAPKVYGLGIISNLSIINAEIKGRNSVGLLAGKVVDGKIINCSAAGVVEGKGIVGGLVGFQWGSLISNCSSQVEVTGSMHQLGGLVGNLYAGKMINSFATGDVIWKAQFPGSCFGGLAGTNYGKIANSYATGDIYPQEPNYPNYLVMEDVGGLAGSMGSESTVTDSYATGDVSGSSKVGGLVGKNYRGKIINSYSTGKPYGYLENVGGLVGFADTEGEHYEDTGNFWNIETSEFETSDMGTGITSSQMKTQNTFLAAGWDFVNEYDNGKMHIWYIQEDNYPKLYWQAKTGDINYDGQINLDDLLIMASQWLASPQAQQRLVADINEDGAVDLTDYAEIAKVWLN